jgi:hypothetical protein
MPDGYSGGQLFEKKQVIVGKRAAKHRQFLSKFISDA